MSRDVRRREDQRREDKGREDRRRKERKREDRRREDRMTEDRRMLDRGRKHMRRTQDEKSRRTGDREDLEKKMSSKTRRKCPGEDKDKAQRRWVGREKEQKKGGWQENRRAGQGEQVKKIIYVYKRVKVGGYCSSLPHFSTAQKVCVCSLYYRFVCLSVCLSFPPPHTRMRGEMREGGGIFSVLWINTGPASFSLLTALPLLKSPHPSHKLREI